MDIVVVTPEIAPYSSWTGAADVAASLPKALRGLGHRVTVISPLWGSIDPAQRHLARRLTRIEVDLAGQKEVLPLFDGRTAAGVDLAMLASATLFPADASAIADDAGAASRWAAFCRGTIELLRRRETKPDVVHLFGWQTAPIALMLAADPTLSALPTVLTIHDLEAHGSFERGAMALFGIDDAHFTMEGVEFYGRFSALKAGIVKAGAITLRSPAQARALAISESPIAAVLRARGKAVTGIADGVDVALWNSATDPHLDTRFDAMESAGAAWGKLRCRSALAKEAGFAVRADLPLCVVAAPSSELGALAEILPRLVRNDVQLFVAAQSPESDAAVSKIASYAARFPDRVALRANADQSLVHRAIGGADLVILPSLDDEAATRQMHAHRYGALAVGRRIGLFADTTVDVDAKLSSGDSFGFDEGTADALYGAITRAIAAYAQTASFRKLQLRAMRVDHAWERAARLTERAYRSVVVGEPAPAPAALPT